MEQCGTKVEQFRAHPFKVMHWNRFFGSGGPMGATYGQNDQFGAKTGLVALNWWNSVGQWGKQARVKPR